MKRPIPVLLVLFCIFLSSCVNHSQPVEPVIRYDKFSGQTTKTMSLYKKNGYGWSLEVNSSLEIKALSHNDQFFKLWFIGRSKNWNYLKYRNVYFYVDGVSKSFGEPDHSGSVHRRSVLEQMMVSVDREFLEKLARSHHAEFKIGITEGVFPDISKTRLKTFLGIN